MEWWAGQVRVLFHHCWVEGVPQDPQPFQQGWGCFIRKERFFFLVVCTCHGEADACGFSLLEPEVFFSFLGYSFMSFKVLQITESFYSFCFLHVSAAVALIGNDKCCELKKKPEIILAYFLKDVYFLFIFFLRYGWLFAMTQLCFEISVGFWLNTLMESKRRLEMAGLTPSYPSSLLQLELRPWDVMTNNNWILGCTRSLSLSSYQFAYSR